MPNLNPTDIQLSNQRLLAAFNKSKLQKTRPNAIIKKEHHQLVREIKKTKNKKIVKSLINAKKIESKIVAADKKAIGENFKMKQQLITRNNEKNRKMQQQIREMKIANEKLRMIIVMTILGALICTALAVFFYIKLKPKKENNLKDGNDENLVDNDISTSKNETTVDESSEI